MRKQRFPIGTQFTKRGDIYTVVDYHVTRNLAGDVIKTCYAAAHSFMGKQLRTYHCETELARLLM